MLRTSERNAFKKCQWAWKKEYHEGLRKRGREATALWFGTGIHYALEQYYPPGTKRGADPVETWKDWLLKFQATEEYISTYQGEEFDEAVPALELGIDMLEGYKRTYGDEEWMEVIASEFPFEIPMKYTKLDGTEATDTYVGKIDLVYRDTRDGKLWIKDFKTTRALGSSNTQYLPLDDQAGAYYAFGPHALRKAGLIGKDEGISGIVYDYLVKAKADKRPVNADGYATNKPQKKHYIQALQNLNVEGLDKQTLSTLESLAAEHGIEVFGEVSKQQPPKRYERVVVRRSRKEQISQIRRVQEDLKVINAVRDGELPALKTPTRECSFCPFRDICELDEAGTDYTDLQENLYRNWNPYGDYEKKEK